MKFALRQNLCYFSIKIFDIKFDRGWEKRSHVSISVSSWQSKSSAALNLLLDVNGIEGMSLVVWNFLHLTRRSMPMNSINIFLLFTYYHARCFIILFNLSLSCFKRLPPQQASPKVSVLLTIEI